MPNTKENMAFRDTSRALPIALLRARERIMAPIREMLSQTGLTEQKWRILRTLYEMGEIEQSTIARETCLLLPSLTRILRAMEEASLVSRRPDPNDKRCTLVSISQSGRELLRNNMAASNAIHKSIETKFGDERLEQLLDLLNDLENLRI